jgi:hypothetical protein
MAGATIKGGRREQDPEPMNTDVVRVVLYGAANRRVHRALLVRGGCVNCEGDGKCACLHVVPEPGTQLT